MGCLWKRDRQVRKEINMRKANLITGEISLCPSCNCMTNNILAADGIFCGKCGELKEVYKK